MNITPVPSNFTIIMPRNERAAALKIKEIMPEAEFTGLSSNSRIDSQGRRWTVNNDPYTKMYSKYDAYAYEWTVGTGEDYRSSYIKNHPTEGMGFEDFLNYVRENGLDKELNALAISADMQNMHGSDYTTLSQQADYLAAYYAQLENHINANFSGDEKAAQMKILKETVGKAISEAAAAYADYAGGFLEGLGQSGEYEKIRSSVESLINDKINSYRDFISENPDFAGLKGTEDEWLTGSHRFMTSELQKAFAASGRSEESTGVYSENDLLYIGKAASSLPADLNRVNSLADEESIGYALGTVMTKLLALGDAMGVSAGASNAIKGAVSRFQEKYMNVIDSQMTERRRRALNSREREGYDPLDRQAVFSVANKMMIEYENTKDLMRSLFAGIAEGFRNHMQKVNSGSHDKQLRYNEDNHYFWLNMYSALDRTESTSMKIEMDGMLFESALEKKNLSVDMGFRELMFGYFTFGSYFAKPEGTVVSELIGLKD